MNLPLSHELTLATVDDIDQILKNYQVVYGRNYPISYGTDPDLLASAIQSPKSHEVWVARNKKKKSIAGSLILEKDLFNRIGKLVGLVVHPSEQNQGLGHHLVNHLSQLHLKTQNEFNSLYATTRTVSIGPQAIFIKNNFLPLGILPNAHRLKQYETVTLFAKFRDGLLTSRRGPTAVSKKLLPLYNAVKTLVPDLKMPVINQLELEDPSHDEDWEFEVIQAPHYVLRRFDELFPDPADRFFPFHTPNILLSEKKGRVEVFAYFSKRDGYCTLIKSTIPFFFLHGQLTGLYLQLHDIGVTYLELLVNAKMKRTIEALLKGNFLPSAIYPAMRQTETDFEDFIVMSRTMEPLNFKGMAVVSSFKPYIDQYIDLWKQLNLETLEVVKEI